MVRRQRSVLGRVDGGESSRVGGVRGRCEVTILGFGLFWGSGREGSVALMKWEFGGVGKWWGMVGDGGVMVGVQWGCQGGVLRKRKDSYTVISQTFYGRTESGSHGLRGVGVYN